MITDDKTTTVRHVRLYKMGDTILHPAEPTGSFVVTPAFALNMITVHAMCLSLYGYCPPILIEHKSDGMQRGEIIDLMVDKYEDEDYMWAAVDFEDGLEKVFDRGLIKNWSPSHFPEWTDPHTGKVYKHILAEASMVGVPYLLNVGAPRDRERAVSMSHAEFNAASSRAIDPPPEEEDGMTDEQIAKMFEGQQQITQAITALPDSIAGAVALALKPEGGGEGDPSEMMSEEVKAEMSALRAAVASNTTTQASNDASMLEMRTKMSALEADKALLQVKAEAPGASDEDIAMLASMTPDQRKYTIVQMSAAATRTTPGQIGGGGSGTTPGAKKESFRVMCSAAKAAGIERPDQTLIGHLRVHHGVTTFADYDAIADAGVIKEIWPEG